MCMMINLDEKKLAAWKESFAKSGIKYETDEEYKEAIYNLVGYFNVLIQMEQKQKIEQRLKSKSILEDHWRFWTDSQTYQGWLRLLIS